jgi:hypothetical protein
MKKKFYAFLLFIPIAVTLFQMNSCNAPKPSNCVITVLDSAGRKPLSGVKVHLYANTTYNGSTTIADLKADAVTDGSGKCNFSFKNPCVMDILATVSNCTVSGANHVYCNGSGIVKCEEGKTAEKTIHVDH